MDELKDEKAVAQGPISIEAITEESLKDLPVEELQALQLHLHQISRVIKTKQEIVHAVMEAKERAAAEDKLAEKANSTEEIDAKITALLKRKEALLKPAPQFLEGSNITSDGSVNPGGKVAAP